MWGTDRAPRTKFAARYKSLAHFGGEPVRGPVRRFAERDGPRRGPSDRRTKNGRVEIPAATGTATDDPKARRAGARICTNTDSPDCQAVPIAAFSRKVGVKPFPALAAPRAAAKPQTHQGRSPAPVGCHAHGRKGQRLSVAPIRKGIGRAASLNQHPQMGAMAGYLPGLSILP